MSVWGYILAIFFIVAPSVGAGIFINWQQLMSVWYKIASRTYVMLAPENLIRHVFKFYGWRVFYWGKRHVKKLQNWCKVFVKRSWVLSRFLWTNPASLLLVIAGIFIAVSLWIFGFDIYELYVELSDQIKKEQKTPDDYRGIAIRYFGIIAGAGAIIGYLIAIARNIIANNQNKINQQGQITESMVQAIAQIGTFNNDKPNIEVRLGGLYALQRIMQDSPRDEDSIAKIFYAYVRENAKRNNIKQPKEDKQAEQKTHQMREDIQTALDIIGQFIREWKIQGKEVSPDTRINFARANLVGYSFKGVDFSRAILEDVDLSGVELYDVNLFDVDLSGADLSGANIFNTDLTGANLIKANLTGASLCDVDLTGADLTNADLTGVTLASVNMYYTDLFGADLFSANLSDVTELSQEQIDAANGDISTLLPEDIFFPESWGIK